MWMCVCSILYQVRKVCSERQCDLQNTSFNIKLDLLLIIISFIIIFILFFFVQESASHQFDLHHRWEDGPHPPRLPLHQGRAGHLQPIWEKWISYTSLTLLILLLLLLSLPLPQFFSLTLLHSLYFFYSPPPWFLFYPITILPVSSSSSCHITKSTIYYYF